MSSYSYTPTVLIKKYRNAMLRLCGGHAHMEDINILVFLYNCVSENIKTGDIFFSPTKFGKISPNGRNRRDNWEFLNRKGHNYFMNPMNNKEKVTIKSICVLSIYVFEVFWFFF